MFYDRILSYDVFPLHILPYRQLAKARPDAFLSDLASSLGARGSVLAAIERHAEAARSFHEGIKILWPAFQKLPAAFALLMASMLRNYQKAAGAADQEIDNKLAQAVIALLDQPHKKQTEE